MNQFKTLCFLLLTLISLKSFGQITISPMEILADIKPGESKNFEVMIVNGSNKPLEGLTFNIKEYINDKGMNKIDTIKVRNNDKPTHDWSIVSFVKADTKNIDPILPKKGKKVTINISIPKDYNKGLGAFSYTIEPNPANAILKKNGFETKTQFFGRSFINIPSDKSVQKLELTSAQVSSKGIVTLNFVNKGDKVLEVKGDIIVLDKNNKQMGKFDLTNQYNSGAQLTVPLKDVSYKMTSALPSKLLEKGNRLIITFRDLRRDFSQSFVKDVKIK